MVRPIISWTIWQRRWSWLAWTAGICAFIVLSLSFYAAFRDQAAQFNELINKLPVTARSFFTDNSDFLSPQGFLSARLYYLLLPLLLSILSIGLGASLIGREEESGTLELLLARPVSRTRVLFAKALSAVIVLGGVCLAALITTLVVCRLVSLNVAIANIMAATLYASLLALIFGSLALAISCLRSGAHRASMGVASLVALASYLLSSLSSTVHWLVWPAKFLPYNYYRPAQILEGHYSWQNAVGLTITVVILLLISWWSFNRRDVGV